MRKIFSLAIVLVVFMLAAGVALAAPDDPVSSKDSIDNPNPGYDYGETVAPEEQDQDILRQRELEALRKETSESSQGSGESSEPVDVEIDPAFDEGNGRDIPEAEDGRLNTDGELGITGAEADESGVDIALTSTPAGKQSSWWLYGGLGAGLVVILGGVLFIRRKAAA